MTVGELKSARDSITAVARAQAQARGDDRAFTFLEPADDRRAPATTFLTFAELDAQAAGFAAALRGHGAPGDRVLLLCAPGPAYVRALLGCLYAGMIAVPAYPPLAADAGERLVRLLADAEPSIVLTSDSLAALYASSGLDAVVRSTGAATLVAERLEAGDERLHRDAGGDDVAVLQYTSGSTGSPRGVVLTHANLLANIAAMLERVGAPRPDDVGVSWLPPYHDMGLIGGIFMPMVAACHTVLLSPLAFLRDPLAWLETIAAHGGTISGGPNFAYELCVRKATPERVAALDLGTWRAAVNGAEPVRPGTLKRFTAAFAPARFRGEAFMPAYGLAEATLMVTAPASEQPPQDRTAPGGGRRVASLGEPVHGTAVAIVDPERRRRRPDGAVGEIWLQGPGVAAGYWNDPAGSEARFAARLADEPDAGPFLRTGDLGFLSDGELYVAGRLKDVIIVRGQNHYPQDLEETADRADPRVRPGCAAAFQLDDDDARVVLVQECHEALPPDSASEVADSVRRAVAREHGVSLSEVVLIARGASLKTSSGKIRRAPTCDAYRAGVLDAIATVRFDDRTAPAPPAERDGPSSARMAALFAELLECEAGPDDDFFALGGDSLSAVELAIVAEERGIAIRPEDLYSAATPRELARLLAERDPDAGGPHGAGPRGAAVARALRSPIARVADAPSHPLSPIQRRWALDYLGDRAKTWGNMALRIPLPDGGDPAVAATAVAHVWAAHESLRTTFPEENGELRQRIHPVVDVPVALHDLSALAPEERGAAAGRAMAAEAATVFDLAERPAVRVALVRTDASNAELHLTMHHMLADGWSLMRLREQLLDAYRAVAAGGAPRVEPPGLRYRDYGAWLSALERSPALDAAREHWLSELDGDLPETLPVDDAIARGPDTRGANVLQVLPSELAIAIKRRARSARRSVTALLYASLFVALQRRTGQRDLIVGTPLAGRERRDVRDVAGMFINLVPVRVRFRRDWQLGDVVDAVQGKLLGAMAHQHYQLDRVVADLELEREVHRFPITRTFFTKLEMNGQRLGQQDGSTTSGRLATDVRFDLMLYAYEFADGLVLDCKYRDALFTQREVADLVDGCVTALRAAVDE
jgi:acyl-CoA synthetase (AMP-forming)/AMP-acid ligase II/acyl carrier protein